MKKLNDHAELTKIERYKKDKKRHLNIQYKCLFRIEQFNNYS